MTRRGFEDEGGVDRVTHNDSVVLRAGNGRVRYTKFKEQAKTDDRISETAITRADFLDKPGYSPAQPGGKR